MNFNFLDKKIPKPVINVLKRLSQKGHIAYLVGGCVRDLLLGIEPKDYDIGTTAIPEEVLEIFSGRAFMVGRRFPIVHVYIGKREYVEVTTFRGREELDLRLKDNYGTPEEDAKRRDLTINALFYDPFNKKIIDYVGGLEDLKKGIIKIIGDPDVRFFQDPVRMLRAIRHASRLNFSIDPKTWDSIKKNVKLIKKIPQERLRDELLKDITGSWVNKWFKLLKKSGLLNEIYPFYERILKEPMFSEKILFKILEFLSKERDLSLEARISLFSYSFLPLIRKSYLPENLEEAIFLERKEILKLFFSLFFTFRFNRKTFEKAMDFLKDLYKLLFLVERGKRVSRKLKKKEYFGEVVRVVGVLRDMFRN